MSEVTKPGNHFLKASDMPLVQKNSESLDLNFLSGTVVLRDCSRGSGKVALCFRDLDT